MSKIDEYMSKILKRIDVISYEINRVNETARSALEELEWKNYESVKNRLNYIISITEATK